MSYICISHASADGRVVTRFCHELTKYGFSFFCMDEHTPADRRDQWLTECAILLILTSPEAVTAGSCATDLRRAAGSQKACVCISLSPNALDERYCSADVQEALPMIPYPGGATETPDERSVALFVHRLYIRRLSRLDDCFSPLQCVDDAYGRAVVLAHRARHGNAEAQFDLGCAYESGQGLPVLEGEAARWFNRAASGGNTDAMIRMGELRLDGEGVERDPAEALRLFSAAARAGDPRGQFAKGVCCLYGYGLMKDPEMAVRYFRAAAADGYIPAFYRLGLLYRDGVGTEKNHRLAVKYLYLAAVGDRQDPPYLYGARFAPQRSEGKLKRKKYTCVSMRYMRQKALQGLLMTQKEDQSHTSPDAAGLYKFCQTSCRGRRVAYPEDRWLEAGLYHPEESAPKEKSVLRERTTRRKSDYSHQDWDPALAESALGRLLELGSASEGIHPSPRAALIWYRRAISRGHSGAMFRLGDTYRSGRGVLADPQQGVRLFCCSADLGHDRGRFAMGVCCERGEGMIADPKRAMSWYELSAKAGYAPAQNNLGGCYEYGIGVPVDYLSAVEWYTRASAGGEPNATCRLGLCYENGRGVSQSYERAFRLYEDAARHKHAYALYRLALYYDRGLTVAPQVAYAAHLYERAARGGVGDAAYAMALCCGEGRGVRRDPQAEIDWLKAAAELGSVQGSYALGMAYFEGTLAVQNRQAAKDAFTRAVSIFEAMNHRVREDADKLLPADAISMVEAVGRSLYMLGYMLVCDDRQDMDPHGALAYFKRSALMGCSEAMTAIGDLYAYGLMDAGSEEQNQSAAMKAYEAAAKEHQIDALLSLAMRYGEMAAKEGDLETADQHKEAAFRCLTRCAGRGNVYALVGMAGSFWLGYGTKKNRDAAYLYLRRANGISDQNSEDQTPKVTPNALAALWLGDLYWTAIRTGATEQIAACVNAACDAYLRAIKISYKKPEGSLYVIPARRQQRLQSEAMAGAAAHYRLAVLCLTYAPPTISCEEIYNHLGAAVLAGHEEALDDVTGLYLYRIQQRAEEKEQTGHGVSERQSKRALRDAPVAQSEALLIRAFGKAYHAAARPVPEPFDLRAPLVKTHDSADLPFVLGELTDTLRAEALNHLADCYFYGRGISKDSGAAVVLYRRAASVKQARDEAVSGGIVWAQYSLGYCLLHGIGTAQNPREAVLWLTAAAKYHGEAALCLAGCHLEGVGVDRKDMQEALKYYRRALKFGCREAEDAIARLKKINQ